MAAGMIDTELGQRLLRVADDQGLPLRDALLGSDDALRPTEIAQPALLFTECVLMSALDRSDVAAVSGHSLGEYAACVAAEALTAEDAMQLVIARGRAMAAMQEGTMAAFIGLDAADVEAICAEVRATHDEAVVVANVNAPGQTVISGSVHGVHAASELARTRGVRRVVLLNVSGAFHSPLMTHAAAAFASSLDAVELRGPVIPVVCNVDAHPARSADELRDRLRRQLTSPVQWIACIEAMLSMGVSTFVEVGPGSVLTGLARRIAPDATAFAISRLEDPSRLSVEGASR
jgi:[acyl-carrier-protein] S-malonyltransferase